MIRGLVADGPYQLLLILAALLLVIELTALAWRHPTFALWLFSGGAVLSAYNWTVGVTVAGVQAYPLDLAAVVAAGATLGNLRSGVRLPRAAVALGALVIFAGLRGIAEFGLQQSVNSARSLLYVVVATVFAATCLPHGLDSLRRVWMVMSLIFLATALAFWAQHGLGSYAATGERALNSAQALVVAHAGFLSLTRLQSRWARPFAGLCLVAVLASQQRTVWASVAVSALVITLLPALRSHRQLAQFARRGLALGIAAAAVLLVVNPSGVRDSATYAADISADQGTLGWRVTGWQGLLDDYGSAGPVDQLVGQPSGTGFARALRGSIETASPHNMYVFTLLSTGLLGLLALLVLYARTAALARMSNPLAFALVIGVVVFSVGYQLAPEQGLLLGVVLATTPSRPSSDQRELEAAR